MVVKRTTGPLTDLNLVGQQLASHLYFPCTFNDNKQVTWRLFLFNEILGYIIKLNMFTHSDLFFQSRNITNLSERIPESWYRS